MKKSIFLFFAAILCAVSMQAKKIYLFPSSDWQSSSAKFGLHTWNASNDSDNKSQLMTKISGVTPVVYEADIPDNHNRVIFLRMNSEANSFDWAKEWTRTQQDIPSDGKNCFFIKGWTDATKWDTYTYTVVGNKTVLGNDWKTEDTNNDMVKIDDDNWALVKRNVSLKKNTTYEYKLVMAHSWDYWSTPSNNAELTVTADGTYDVMFTYNYKTNKLTHTAVLPQTIYCINTQEWNNVSIHNWLTDKITTTWPGDAMTKTGEKWAGYDIYKKEISGLHKYCIFNNNNGKQTSDLTIEGTYYELGSGKWYKELPTPKICWKGDVNNWSEDNTFAVTSDPNLLTTTVTLSEGKHDFKITICDLWLGNSGTMKRHGESVHEGGWEFKNKKDNGTETDKCKIEADIAGDYIFTWNISEKKLTVTYPSYPDLSNQPSPIYFKPTEAWKTNNPRFAAYFCKGNMKDKWEDLTDTDGDGIYEVNNAKEHTTVIIVRMNPAYDENRWNTYEEDHSANKPVWNKTEDLLIPMDGNDFFIMNGANFDNTGYWSLYVPTIQLVDGDNRETIAKYYNKKVNAQVNRTFVANDGYYTICLPFDLQASEIGIAYQVTSITEHIADKGFNMVFSEVSELKAGQPYLMLPNDLTNPIFENVTISYIGNGEQVRASGAGVNFDMQGIINGNGSTNGLYWVGTNGYFYNDDTSILGLRTYFSITDNAGKPINIRARVMVSENAATGLDNITNGENTTIKVIENGQLIIIRNGEKFNAQGIKL